MNKSNKVFFLFLCFITGFAFAAPEVESVAISGDKLIVTGHKFLDIDGLTLSDPQTGFKKPFKVESATESEIVGTAVDNQKITVASLMNLIIDTAKGETTYPVSFSLQKDAVTNPTIKNGAITPEKFVGVTTPNPPDQSVLTWDEPTQSFIFTSGSEGGGSSGVSDIVFGAGITGAPNTASGSVPISVDIGATGSTSKTKIPYFNSKNKIVLDSTTSPVGSLTGLSFKDGTQNFYMFNDNGLRINSNVAPDLLVLGVDGNLSLKGPVTVGGFDVCLSSGNCTSAPSGTSTVTATAPLIAATTATGTTNISAGVVNTANNLVQLDAAGKFPATIPGVVRVPGTVTAGTLAIYSNTTGENLGNSGVGLQNLVTMPATPTTANKIVISTGANRALGTTAYTIPNTSGVTGQVLAITATNTASWINGGGVSSFNTRTGAVVPVAGDYTADQVSNLPFGIITATTVQQAIDQLADLDSQKLPKAGGTMTGTITTSTQNALKIGPFATGTGEVQFLETAANGTNYIGFKSPASISTNTVWILPAADGSSGTVLSTNGSKQLAWTSLGAAGVGNVVGPSSSTSTNLATFNGTTGKLIQDSGISSNNLVTMSGAASTSGNVIVTGGGKLAQDSNIPLSNLPIMQNPAIASNTIILSVGNSKDLKSTPYTIPPIIGSATYALKSDGTNVQWAPDESGTGDVVGPANSTDTSIPTFSGTTGKLLQSTLFNINGNKLNGPNFAIGENSAYGDYVACFSYLDYKDSYNSPGFCQDSGGGAHMKGEFQLIFSLAGTTKLLIEDDKTTNRQDLVNDGNFRVGSNSFFVNSTSNYVGIGTLTPTQALQIDSTISGFLPPRMTTAQKNFMSFPPPGLIVYDTDLGSLNVRNASGWLPLAGGTGDVVGPATATLNSVARYESGKVIKESGIIIDDANNISGIVQLNGKVVNNLITGSGLVGNLPIFGLLPSEIEDSGIASINIPTMVSNATAAFQPILSAGNNKSQIAAPYTLPNTSCLAGEVLKWNATGFTCQADFGGTGNVAGPATSSSNTLAQFSDSSGKSIKGTAWTVPTNIGGLGQYLAVGGSQDLVWTNFPTTLVYVGGAPVVVDNLPKFGGSDGTQIIDSGIATANVPTMVAPAASSNTVILSNGADKTLKTTNYTIPGSIGSASFVLKSDGTNVQWAPDGAGTGDVVGPPSSTAQSVAIFSGVDGKELESTLFNINGNALIGPSAFMGQNLLQGPDMGCFSHVNFKASFNDFGYCQSSSGKAFFGSGDSVHLYVNGFAKLILESSKTTHNQNFFQVGDFTVDTNTFFVNAATNSVGIGTATPTQVLQIDSTTSGFLPPRMSTAQKNAINPQTPGLVIFDSDLNSLSVRTSTGWISLADGTGNVIGPATSTVNNFATFSDGAGKIIKDSGINSGNLPTMVPATKANQIIISAGAGKQLTTTIYPIPTAIGATGTVLKSDGANATWQPDSSGTGDVAGPATATLNSIARYESGKIIKESGITIDDANNISGINNLNGIVVNNLITGSGLVGNLPIFGLLPSELEDSGIPLINIPNMASNATAAFHPILSGGANKSQIAAPYTLPSTTCLPGEVLKWNATGFTCQADFGGSGDVAGPATSSSNTLAQFSDSTGKIIKGTAWTVPTNIGGLGQFLTVSGASDLNWTSLPTTLVNVGNAPVVPNNLSKFGGSDGTQILDSGIATANVPTMLVAATSLNTIILSGGADKTLKSTAYTIPSTIGSANFVLKSDGTNATWQADVAGTGDVAGPATATLNSVARYQSGKVIKESGIIIDDANNISGVAQLNNKVANNLVTGTGIGVGGNLPVYAGMSPTEIIDSGIALINIPTMASNATAQFHPILSAGNNRSQIAAPYTLPNTTCLAGEVLKWSTTGFTCQSDMSGSGDVAGPATSTLNNFAAFSDTTGKNIKDSGINSGNLPTMATAASAANKIIISAGANKQFTTTLYPISAAIGASGTVLKSDGTNATWQADVAGTGDVAGPATATLNSVARFQSGKIIKNSGIIIDDTNNISGVAQINSKVANNLVTGTGIGVGRNLPMYVGMSPTEIEDSGISLDNIPTMASNAAGQFHPILSGGNNKTQIAAPYSLPNTGCSTGEVLKWDTTGFICQSDLAETSSSTILLTEWVAGKAYKAGEIVNTGSDKNWLFKVVSDHTSTDVPVDLRSGKIMPIAPPIITTGVQDGGATTLAGNVATVQAGTGYIAKYGTSPSAWPLITIVEWPTQTIILPTVGIHTLYIDESGVLFSKSGVDYYSAQDDTISVGIVDMNLNMAHERKTYPTNPVGQLRGLAFFFGGMSKGLSYTPSVTKELARTAHEVYFWGANPADPYDPNARSYAATNPVQFFEFSQNGTVSPAPRTQLRNMWDDAGTLTAMPGGKWGFARIYSTLGAEDYIMYGQALYANEPDAREAAVSASFIKPLELTNTKFSSWVVFKGSDDDFSDNSVVTCEPFGCDKIGSAAGGGTGGGDVLGPASAIGGNLASFSDTSGKVIQDSGINIADLPNMASNAGALYRPILSADGNKKLMAAPFSLPIIDGSPGQILQTNGAGAVAWVDVPVSSALEYPYMFESVVSDADPGNGKIQINNANPSLATFIYVADEDGNLLTVNRRLRFFLLKAGDLINITSTSDPNNNYLFNVTGNVVPATGYVKIPISLKTITGTIADAQRVTVALVLKSVGSSTTSLLAETSNILMSPSGFVPPTSAGVPGQMLISSGIGTPATWKNLANFGSSASLPSDKKLKKEIKNLPEGYIERLMDLRPVSFVWRDSHNPDMGFIAQDMSKVFPDLVENNNDILGINYSKLVVPIVKAFQEKVQKDEQTIKMLLERIERLEKIIGEEAKK